MSKNLISVLTASKSDNLNHYLGYVNSINTQVVKPNELIFVDDGIKNQNFKNFLKQNINKNIKLKYIRNNTNLGISKSLNFGLNECSNDFIFRLDIDDIWEKDHIKLTFEEYKLNKNFLIYSNSFNIKKKIPEEYIILDNPSIHSSWMINRNKEKKFQYSPLFPEDFATLSYYYQNNCKFRLLKKKTVKYIENLNSFSKKKIANKDLNKIKASNLNFFKKKLSFYKIFKIFDLKDILKILIKVYFKI